MRPNGLVARPEMSPRVAEGVLGTWRTWVGPGPGDRWLVNVGDVLPKMSRMFQASKYSIMFKNLLRIAIYV